MTVAVACRIGSQLGQIFLTLRIAEYMMYGEYSFQLNSPTENLVQ